MYRRIMSAVVTVQLIKGKHNTGNVKNKNFQKYRRGLWRLLFLNNVVIFIPRVSTRAAFRAFYFFYVSSEG